MEGGLQRVNHYNWCGNHVNPSNSEGPRPIDNVRGIDERELWKDRFFGSTNLGDVFSGKGEHLGILQEWFGIHWWNSRYLSILLTVLLVVLPLVLYRRVESLWLSSAIAIILAVVFVGICSVMAIIAIAKGQIVRPRMLPDLNSSASFFNLFTAIPVIVTAFAFHFNVHPIEIELGIPGAMTSVVKISLVVCSVIYFSIGIFGYLLFGDSINADILVNFDTSSSGDVAISPILNDVVRLSYALHLTLVFPLLNFSLRANIDELIFPKKELLATDTKRFMFLTLFLLAFSYIVAISIPSVWYIYQFMGSTSNVCLAFIFPGAIAIRSLSSFFPSTFSLIILNDFISSVFMLNILFTVWQRCPWFIFKKRQDHRTSHDCSSCCDECYNYCCQHLQYVWKKFINFYHASRLDLLNFQFVFVCCYAIFASSNNIVVNTKFSHIPKSIGPENLQYFLKQRE
ncbi:amino acid transporter AVT6C-like isoform X3 [Solanum dulcamara]|uniref:amino acid transporter AVT6C-like isoform X3 n=1 Tax=Solanum dulcamara TaxID=45834 RepID=UPI002485C141|nr:amino acid transporter AVT6C-like isoform X3 [Solanum dulcamara]